MYKLMTAGPTRVAKNVMEYRSMEFVNPDTDISFCEFYKDTCNLISELLYTKNETIILGGEGILALESACATLTEQGDRVLVLDNGIFGEGFKDFVTMYGGTPYLYTKDYKNALDIEELKSFLQKDNDFKYATIVHCDTPSGVLNDIESICNLLSEYGIISVVDAVSSMFGEYINIDKCKADLVCGASQKVVSAPPGLAFVTISDKAKDIINKRKTPIASFYANLKVFENYYENKWFPYTMPVSDIMGLSRALQNIKEDKNILQRHSEVASYTRQTLEEIGYKLYLESGFSNTVSSIEVPKNLTADYIIKTILEKHNILICNSLGVFKDKVVRIGHMGENANINDVTIVLNALKELMIG